MEARRWMPQPNIAFGCADISFSWPTEQRAPLVVVMHFSRVIDGHDKDLQITFRRPLALKWEQESFGLAESPDVVPHLSHENFKGWTHPTLIIDGSKWREAYAARSYPENDPREKNLVHYFLVSLNDLVHVLAEGEPESKWVQAN